MPTLIIQGDDDQIVPFADSGLLQSKLIKGADLKVYKGAPAWSVHDAQGPGERRSARVHRTQGNAEGCLGPPRAFGLSARFG